MEATSNESSSSPSSESSAPRAQSSTAVPKKKRVRRQQLELKYLRELSGELERRLGQLKKQRLCSPQTAQCRSSSEGGGVSNCSSTNLTGKIKYGPVSVWEAIADHQLNERSRAEKSNKKLRLLLRKQISMIQSLQARAQKVFGNEELTMMQLRGEGPRYWDLGSENEEIVFADLLVLVARTRLEIQKRQLEDPRSVLSFATWGVSLGKPYVRAHSEAGLVMETHACSLLPFNVTTTAAAYWRTFSLSPAKHEIAPDDAQSSDVFVRSFTCSSNHFGENIDERGKHTCRRYVEENGCITIVFAGRTGPTKSAAYQDVQLQRTSAGNYSNITNVLNA
ncbi:hypothetical protein PR001_g13532 [Phytophthora rubi]|uniref:Uncharacterized protein n=1 Tax=Phytophthora rubi TaxID=129364 RepID=A0A6A3LQV2_9STRA|nr:hypothetical protein PR002_g13941 [Phytophthora rubi]KAE9020700.1 hypothetical protein PR001_g13532 [Phytophthora rubi]